MFTQQQYFDPERLNILKTLNVHIPFQERNKKNLNILQGNDWNGILPYYMYYNISAFSNIYFPQSVFPHMHA